jgi:hypothetical protein
MKKLLFLLMMVASVASAHPRSDAELKALISDGVWNYDVGRKSGYVAFRPDGVLLTDGEGLMKWDIKDGVLDEIDTPETEGVDRDKWQREIGRLLVQLHHPFPDQARAAPSGYEG